ncbi:3342_t:CDS:2, partial [Gigaspora rosea]
NNQEHINDNLIDQQLFYGKVWGLIHTAANKCVLHNDNEFVKMIENYLDDICKREKEHNKVHQVGIIATKGRPKSASHHMNNTNQQLANKKKRNRDTSYNTNQQLTNKKRR